MSQVYSFEVAMTCEGCANSVKKVLGKLGDKVANVDVNVAEKTVKVTTPSLSQSEVLEQLKKTGLDVKEVN